ncbi:hypothetical protein [Actinomadura sp. WMMB 499]|nr:hypothetical protein [Actinomadura sp. WMMB 499]
MRVPRVITGFSCVCGGRVEPGNRRCRKCRARARWQRRKRGSRYPDLWL